MKHTHYSPVSHGRFTRGPTMVLPKLTVTWNIFSAVCMGDSDFGYAQSSRWGHTWAPHENMQASCIKREGLVSRCAGDVVNHPSVTCVPCVTMLVCSTTQNHSSGPKSTYHTRPTLILPQGGLNWQWWSQISLYVSGMECWRLSTRHWQQFTTMC